MFVLFSKHVFICSSSFPHVSMCLCRPFSYSMFFFLLGACTAPNPIHMCTLHVHVYTNTYTGQRLSVGRLLILQKYTRIIFEDFLPKIQLSQCRGIITNSLLSPQERRSSAVSLTKQTSPTGTPPQSSFALAHIPL